VVWQSEGMMFWVCEVLRVWVSEGLTVAATKETRLLSNQKALHVHGDPT
jgi:hypothetical protein